MTSWSLEPCAGFLTLYCSTRPLLQLSSLPACFGEFCLQQVKSILGCITFKWLTAIIRIFHYFASCSFWNMLQITNALLEGVLDLASYCEDVSEKGKNSSIIQRGCFLCFSRTFGVTNMFFLRMHKIVDLVTPSVSLCLGWSCSALLAALWTYGYVDNKITNVNTTLKINIRIFICLFISEIMREQQTPGHWTAEKWLLFH